MNLLLQGVINGMLASGTYMLVASGLTLIFGAMKIINFAHGELVMVGAYVSYWLFAIFHLDPLLSLPVSFVAVGLLGAIIQQTAIWPVLRSKSHLNQILATFALSLVLQNAALLLWTADTRKATPPYTTAGFQIGGLSFGVPQLLSFAVAIPLMLGLFIWLRRSTSGKMIRAVSQDPLGSELVGISVNRVYLIAFVLAAALAGAAGSLISFTQYVSPTVGLPLSLKAYAIVILGGQGSIVGAVIGSMILGVVESLTSLYLSSTAASAIAFVIVIAVLAIRPGGLYGSSSQT
jgi:branched-chain amino acid transport system permease protein